MSAMTADLFELAASHDILAIGMLADESRRRGHGTRTTFVRVADVSSDPGAAFSIPATAGEVRISGTPRSVADAVARVGEIAAAVRGTPVSAFSLSDLEELAAREATPLRSILEGLRAAGLELIAEAPFDKLASARRSIEEVNISGLTLARLTIHQLTSADLPASLQGIAALQHSVAVVRAFAPLPRRPNPSLPTTGYEDVKRVALARLFIGNIPSIQVDWGLYGPKLAQVALTMGADDLDAVSPSDEAPEGPRRAPLEEVRRNIRAAGFEAAERDGRFELRR